MIYIVVDTCVFTRLQGKYSSVFECIQRNGDVIAVSKNARDEYEMQARASIGIMQSFLKDLHDNNQSRNFNSSYIESKLRAVQRRRRIAYPQDTQDKKWVKLAVSSGARYILTTDSTLLHLRPNPCINNQTVECIGPEEFLQQRCPDLAEQ